MKKKYIPLLILACLLAFACKQSANRATIYGSVDNYKDEGYLLCVYWGNDEFEADTLVVQSNGQFEYSRSFEQPAVVYLYLDYLFDDAVLIPFYMANGCKGTITITSSIDEAEQLHINATYEGDLKAEWEYIQASYNSPDIKTKEIAEFKDFKTYETFVKEKMNTLRALLDKSSYSEFKASEMRSINAREQSLLLRFARAQRKISERMDADADFAAYIKTIDLNEDFTLTDEILDLYLVYEPNPDKENAAIRKMKLIKKMITNQDVINKLSYTLMLLELPKGNAEDITAMYELYKQINTDTSFLSQTITTMYNQSLKLLKGASAIDFEMQDAQGNTLHFLDIIGKGKVVYVDFWASWCGPCVAEISHLAKLVERYKDNPDIVFVSISLDEVKNLWNRRLEKDNPTWPQYIVADSFGKPYTETACAKAYNINGIPRFMAFDKKGRIIDVNAPRPSDPNINSFLQSCLKFSIAQ